MQKHERQCLSLAREEATKLSGDLTVSFHTHKGHAAKSRLTLHGPKGERHRSIPCSPGRVDDIFAHIRQWVRREGKEIV